MEFVVFVVVRNLAQADGMQLLFVVFSHGEREIFPTIIAEFFVLAFVRLMCARAAERRVCKCARVLESEFVLLSAVSEQNLARHYCMFGWLAT